MPDIKSGITQRLAGFRIHQHHGQLKWNSRFILRDVAPECFVVDVIRTLLLLTDQDAARRGRESRH